MSCLQLGGRHRRKPIGKQNSGSCTSMLKSAQTETSAMMRSFRSAPAGRRSDGNQRLLEPRPEPPISRASEQEPLPNTRHESGNLEEPIRFANLSTRPFRDAAGSAGHYLFSDLPIRSPQAILNIDQQKSRLHRPSVEQIRTTSRGRFVRIAAGRDHLNRQQRIRGQSWSLTRNSGESARTYRKTFSARHGQWCQLDPSPPVSQAEAR